MHYPGLRITSPESRGGTMHSPRMYEQKAESTISGQNDLNLVKLGT